MPPIGLAFDIIRILIFLLLFLIKIILLIIFSLLLLNKKLHILSKLFIILGLLIILAAWIPAALEYWEVGGAGYYESYFQKSNYILFSANLTALILFAAGLIISFIILPVRVRVLWILSLFIILANFCFSVYIFFIIKSKGIAFNFLNESLFFIFVLITICIMPKKEKKIKLEMEKNGSQES